MASGAGGTEQVTQEGTSGGAATMQSQAGATTSLPTEKQTAASQRAASLESTLNTATLLPGQSTTEGTAAADETGQSSAASLAKASGETAQPTTGFSVGRQATASESRETRTAEATASATARAGTSGLPTMQTTEEGARPTGLPTTGKLEQTEGTSEQASQAGGVPETLATGQRQSSVSEGTAATLGSQPTVPASTPGVGTQPTAPAETSHAQNEVTASTLEPASRPTTQQPVASRGVETGSSQEQAISTSAADRVTAQGISMGSSQTFETPDTPEEQTQEGGTINTDRGTARTIAAVQQSSSDQGKLSEES